MSRAIYFQYDIVDMFALAFVKSTLGDQGILRNGISEIKEFYFGILVGSLN